MRLVLGAKEAQRARLSYPPNLLPIRDVDRFPLPVHNPIELHEFHSVLAHGVVGLFLMHLPQEMQDHAEEQKRANPAAVGL